MSKIPIHLLVLIGLATYSNSMFLVHRILNGIPDGKLYYQNCQKYKY